MKTNLSRFTRGVLAVALTFAAASSHASLILVAPENFGGSGLGSVNTILTIQNSPTETGSVSFNGTTDVITGDAKTGSSQTQTRTLSELGINNANGLRVVFNAAEPGGNSIILDRLILNIYNAAGATLFTSGSFGAVNFPNTLTGTGNSGYVFALDAASIVAATTSVFTSANFGDLRVGLSAAGSASAGGNETFFVANSRSSAPANPIPEPATIALFGLGLLGASLARRVKK